MKRIILVVSLVFISLFISSCKKEEENYGFIDGPLEIGYGYIPMGTTSSDNFEVGVGFSSKSKKNKFKDNIDMYFNFGQLMFYDDGKNGPANYTKNHTIHKPDEIKYFSKVEARIALANKKDLQIENFIYLNEYIDLTFNNSYKYIDLELNPINEHNLSIFLFDENKVDEFLNEYGNNYTQTQFSDAYSNLIRLYSYQIQKRTPYKISFKNILQKNSCYFMVLDVRYTFSDDFINSELFSGFDNSYYSVDKIRKISENQGFRMDEIWNIYTDSKFIYLDYTYDTTYPIDLIY